MAKLERVTAKVFASDAPADKIGQFGSALAGTKLETGDVSTIQALPAYTEGWSSAVISQRNYPVLQETNGVMKNMSYQTAYIMQNGIAEYDPNTEYYTGSICKGIGNTNQYASWGDENVGNTVTNTNYWKNVTPVNYSNITNCITEIPQRIKYTLENGTLTIKAGSVVIVPYGTEDLRSQYPVGATFINDNFKVYDTQFADGKFFVWAEIQNDLSITYAGSTPSANGMFFIDIVNGVIYLEALINIGSGAGSTTVLSYYNTTTNKLTHNQTGTISLPVLECTFGTSITNSFVINQVFNGMGYIGSTAWVDKGVKGLISNGRNKDGTLNNIVWENETLLVSSCPLFSDANTLAFNIYGNSPSNRLLHINYNGESASWVQTPTGSYGSYYNITNNLVYTSNGQGGNYVSKFLPLATMTGLTNITSFYAKQSFRAADAEDIDGNWVSSRFDLANNITMSSNETIDYDLSSYLPKDNNLYEVMVTCTARTNTTANSNFNLYVYGYIGFSCLFRATTRTNNYVLAGGNCLTIIGTDRKIRISAGASNTGDIENLQITAYRKVR